MLSINDVHEDGVVSSIVIEPPINDENNTSGQHLLSTSIGSFGDVPPSMDKRGSQSNALLHHCYQCLQGASEQTILQIIRQLEMTARPLSSPCASEKSDLEEAASMSLPGSGSRLGVESSDYVADSLFRQASFSPGGVFTSGPSLQQPPVKDISTASNNVGEDPSLGASAVHIRKRRPTGTPGGEVNITVPEDDEGKGHEEKGSMGGGSMRSPYQLPRTRSAQTMRGGGFRRTAISATPVAVQDVKDFEAPIYEKPDEEKTKLLELIKQCPLFRELEYDEKQIIVSALKKEEFTAGTEIIQQRKPPLNRLFLIFQGTVEVLKNEQVITAMSEGQFFGELELMYNVFECAATVQTVVDCTFFSLDQATYRNIVLSAAMAKREKYYNRLRGIKFFKDLSEYDVNLLADALKISFYHQGENVIKFGSPGQFMHIILEGDCSVVGRKDGKHVEIVRLGPSDHFGELEFLFDTMAVADVVAVNEVKTAKIGRKDFESLFGIVSDHLKTFVAKGNYAYFRGQTSEEVSRDMETAVRRSEAKRRASEASPSTSLHDVNTVIGNLNEKGEILLSTELSEAEAQGHFGTVIQKMVKETNVDIQHHEDEEGERQGEEGVLKKYAIHRFPLQPFLESGMVVIGLKENGTIVSWNTVMESLTDFRSVDVCGQSCYSYVTEPRDQVILHSCLIKTAKWAGETEGYFQSGEYQKKYQLTFARSDGLTKVQFQFQFIPSISAISNEIVLAIGTEKKAKPKRGGELDPGAWLSERLQQLLQNPRELFDDSSQSISTLPNAMLMKPGDVSISTLPNSAFQTFEPVITAVQGVLNRYDAVQKLSSDECWDNMQMVDIAQLIGQATIDYQVTALEKRMKIIAITNDGDTRGEKKQKTTTENAKSPLNPPTSPGSGELKSEKSITKDESSELPSRLFCDVKVVSDALRFVVSTLVHSAANDSTIKITTKNKEELGMPFLALTVQCDGGILEHYIMHCLRHPDEEIQEGHHVAQTMVKMKKCIESIFGTMKVVCHRKTKTTVVEMSFPYLPNYEGLEDDDSVQNADGLETATSFCLTSGSADTSVPSVAPLSGSISPGDKKKNLQFTTLVVEAQAIHKNRICGALWDRKHAVLHASAWNEIVPLLESNSVDILIIDPHQDILQLTVDEGGVANPLSLLRTYARDVAIVITSSAFEQATRAAYSAAGFFTLNKPCTTTQVTNCLKKAEGKMIKIKLELERIAQTRENVAKTYHADWKKGKLLGRGQFGEVYEATDEITGGTMAVKMLRVTPKLDKQVLLTEIEAMCHLKHKNIIHYFYCDDRSEEEQKIYLFMEAALGGTLQDYMRRKEKLDMGDLVEKVADIVDGTSYIHSQHFVHCDLKTANVLLSGDGRCKIGDFGSARQLEPGTLLYVMQGTPLYMSPECLGADEETQVGYDFAADIWSLGVIVLEMATNKPAFSHIPQCQSSMGLMKYLADLSDTPDLSILFDYPPAIFQFVRACLDLDPSKRPKASELREFALLQDVALVKDEMGDGRGDNVKLASAIKALEKGQYFHQLSAYKAFQTDEDVAVQREILLDKAKTMQRRESDFFDSSSDDDDSSKNLKPSSFSSNKDPRSPFGGLAKQHTGRRVVASPAAMNKTNAMDFCCSSSDDEDDVAETPKISSLISFSNPPKKPPPPGEGGAMLDLSLHSASQSKDEGHNIQPHKPPEGKNVVANPRTFPQQQSMSMSPEQSLNSLMAVVEDSGAVAPTALINLHELLCQVMDVLLVAPPQPREAGEEGENGTTTKQRHHIDPKLNMELQGALRRQYEEQMEKTAAQSGSGHSDEFPCSSLWPVLSPPSSSAESRGGDMPAKQSNKGFSVNVAALMKKDIDVLKELLRQLK